MKIVPMAMTAAIFLGLVGCSQSESVTKLEDSMTSIETGIEKCDGKKGEEFASCMEPLQAELMGLQQLMLDAFEDDPDAVEDMKERGEAFAKKITEITLKAVAE